jgi:hypothetical protein
MHSMIQVILGYDIYLRRDMASRSSARTAEPLSAASAAN